MEGRGIRRTARLLVELGLLVVVAVAAICAAKFGFNRYYLSAYPMKYADLIDAACTEKQLDRALLYAVTRTESGFRPDAESQVGARGLLQLMPDAYDWVRMRKGESGAADYDKLFDPATSVEYGASMLRLLLDEFGSVDNALCAYHAGWGRVKEWLKDPDYAPDGVTVTQIPFADTRSYVVKVKKTMEIYRKLYQL